MEVILLFTSQSKEIWHIPNLTWFKNLFYLQNEVEVLLSLPSVLSFELCGLLFVIPKIVSIKLTDK